MKKLIVAVLCAATLFVGCGDKAPAQTALPAPAQTTETVQSTETEDALDSPGFWESVSPSDLPEEAEDLADEFSTDADFGEKLESAYDSDLDNQDVAAMYFYYRALKYVSGGNTDMAKNLIANIPTDYSGLMADKITIYGVKLFGSTANWGAYTAKKQEDQAKITDALRKQVINWVKDRADDYEKQAEGDPEQYVDKIINEAAQKFGLTDEQIYNVLHD